MAVYPAEPKTSAWESAQAAIVDEIGKAAVAFRIDCFREVDLPTQSIVDGQLRRDSPSVLTVEEPPLLAFGGTAGGRQVGIGDVPSERGHLSQQERPQVQAARTGARRCLGAEVVFARSIVVTGDTQVQCIANVGPELNLMIAPHLRPVVDELDLLFALGQRAIATGNT